MYLIFPILFLILVLFFIINHRKKKRIIHRLLYMTFHEKCCLLNSLSEPFGFCYDCSQDIFSTDTDAWQKAFGYGKIYDKAALSLNIIFDSEPVYFNYDKRTWLIQFWKGQYGINAGAEVGIYHADKTVAPALRGQTIFQAADEDEMLPVQIQLYFRNEKLFSVCRPHWWLTGFCMGFWAPPEDLSAEIAITFPNPEMCAAFVRSLTDLGYRSHELWQDGTTVQILFTQPKTVPTDFLWLSDWREHFALWRTKLFCILFLKITSPFRCTADRLLYLYYYLPSVFRRIICIRHFKKRRKERRLHRIHQSCCKQKRRCSCDHDCDWKKGCP